MTAGESGFRAEIDDLRGEIIGHFALVLIPLCMAGLFLTMTLATRADAPWSMKLLQPVVLIELCVLLLGLLYGWLRWTEHRALAYRLFAWGLFALSIADVFANPGAFAAVWSGIACMLLMLMFGPPAGWAGVGILLVSLVALPGVRPEIPAQPMQILAAVSPAVLLVAFMQLVARVLLRNLQWTTESYEAVRLQSDLLRDQGAQLGAALKSLNQTSFALARANEQLEIMVRFAEDARSAKQEFAANISHELRAPLNLIIGFSDMILYGAEHPERYGGFGAPPAWLADLHVVRRNAAHLLKLVNDILDLSQMDMAYMTIVRKPTDVDQFIHSALEELGPLIHHRGLALDVQVEPDLPVIYLDQNRILQVLLNLVNNALRFTEQGGITIRASRSQDAPGQLAPGEEQPASPPSVVISVTDTGAGIPAADTQRIFEPFIQASNAKDNPKLGGSGLGLTISKRFVELHGGQMGVHSTLGVGSTFFFTLPVTPPLPLADTSSTRRVVHRRELGSLAVVERVPLLSTILERQLEGIDVRHFHSAAELSSELASGAFDCPEAILYNQPVNTPPDITQLPNALTQLPVLQCYVPAALDRLAQYGATTDTGQAISSERYLLKPFSHEQLYQAIGNLLDAPPDPAPGDGAAVTLREKSVARIFVVDDDADTATLIGRMVRLMPAEFKRGYAEVVTIEAHSGAQAIDFLNHLGAPAGIPADDAVDSADAADAADAASAAPWDIAGVLLDIRLGDMSGFEVLYAMEQHARLRRVPVCVMTGDVVEVRGGPPITSFLTLARHGGLSTRELGESIAALLKIMLPGARVGLSPSVMRQPVEPR
jgi:signal transduction histidine kinase/CheY-like chemotaxis protein